MFYFHAPANQAESEQRANSAASTASQQDRWMFKGIYAA